MRLCAASFPSLAALVLGAAGAAVPFPIVPVAQDRRARVAFDCLPDDAPPYLPPCSDESGDAATDFSPFGAFVDLPIADISLSGSSFVFSFGTPFDACANVSSEHWAHLVSEIGDDRYRVSGDVWECSQEGFALSGIPGGTAEAFGDLTFDLAGTTEYHIDYEVKKFPDAFCSPEGCDYTLPEIALRLERVSPDPGVVWDHADCAPVRGCDFHTSGRLPAGRYTLVARGRVDGLPYGTRRAGAFSVDLRVGPGVAPPPTPAPALPGAWVLALVVALGAAARRYGSAIA